jgi:hypothetical protein
MLSCMLLEIHKVLLSWTLLTDLRQLEPQLWASACRNLHKRSRWGHRKRRLDSRTNTHDSEDNRRLWPTEPRHNSSTSFKEFHDV